MAEQITLPPNRTHAWNRGRLMGAKPPLKPRHIWSIRTRLELERRVRDLAMFNCAIDTKLRGSDLVKLTVPDVTTSTGIRTRSAIVQKKTGRSVPFEITEPTRDALTAWLALRGKREDSWLFPSRTRAGEHLKTRQYARLVDRWGSLVGLDPGMYGTHSLRRTKVSMVYRRTGNLRACQLLLGHTKLESTVRYLGIEVDDALAMSEQTEL